MIGLALDKLRHRFDRWCQRLLLRWLVALLGPKQPALPPPTEDVRRILLIRLDPRMGNSVLLLPMLRQLVRCFPHASIEVLISPQGAQIIQHSGLPITCRLFCKRHLWGNASPMYRLLWMRRQGYDICFDGGSVFHPSFTQAAMGRLSGAQIFVGMANHACSALYDICVTLPQRWHHEVMMRMALLLPWRTPEQLLQVCTLQDPHGPLCMPYLADSWPRSAPGGALSQWLASLPTDLPWLGLYPGARESKRQLSMTYLDWLINALNAWGCHVMLITGPQERAWRQQMKARWSKVMWAPETNVVELGQVLQHCHGIISADTGPMHLAVALGVPTMACFTTTDPQRYGYWLGLCTYGYQQIDGVDGDFARIFHRWLMNIYRLNMLSKQRKKAVLISQPEIQT